MILTMHGMTTMHCNMKTDIWLAGETGFKTLLQAIQCSWI